jgi:YidC/Oxa1 family membrane protein insertase
MTSTRNILLIALLFISYLLWTKWDEDYNAPAPPPAASGATTSTASVGDTPNAAPAQASASTTPAAVPNTDPASANATAPVAPVVVTTDVLRIEIDPRGGNIVVADLLAYPQQPKDFAHPVRLLDNSNATWFVAQSGLIGTQGSAIAAPDHSALYHADKNSYALEAGDTLEVPLTWIDASGLTVRKVFTFKRGSYVIDQREEIHNAAATAWNGNVSPAAARAADRRHQGHQGLQQHRALFVRRCGDLQPGRQVPETQVRRVPEGTARQTFRRRLGGDAPALLLRRVDSAGAGKRHLHDERSRQSERPALPDPRDVAVDRGRAGRDED